jgi:pSer/pThr/pTyr-binding forkhead associated (FHA) protein
VQEKTMQKYGSLVLAFPDGDEQSFELAKPEVIIGRGLENDIVLKDARASRRHVRVECSPEGCFFVDLGSANGTHLNNTKVERGRLSPGDVLRVGNSSLRFEAILPELAPDVTTIDNLVELEHTMARETVAMTLYDTSRPRIVVSIPGNTWEVPLVADRVAIGRHPESDIALDQTKVSRHHAQIERHGSAFVIKDLGSTNGTWLGDQAIEKHLLSDGDTVRIGEARLVFKAPFTIDDLTQAVNLHQHSGQGRIPVVFVPGLMGSELWAGSERIWPNVRYLFTQPEIFALPEKTPLEPRGILNEVVIVPNLVKQDQYNRLGDFLVESLGYQRGIDLFEFAYDWRRDVRDSARVLAQMVENWGLRKPFMIVAHSLGSLVSRYYVERLGGKKVVERVIFMGGPHYGVPKAVGNLVAKVDLLPFGLMGDRLRKVLVTFPSMYQILPLYDCVYDQNGKVIPVLKDGSWLEEAHRPLLQMAYQFRKEVGTRLSVPSVSVFGYGLKTANRINVRRKPDGEWERMDVVTGLSGDDTIPDSSTVLDGSEIHPVQQHHGSLFVDNDVKMFLKLQLTGRRR